MDSSSAAPALGSAFKNSVLSTRSAKAAVASPEDEILALIQQIAESLVDIPEKVCVDSVLGDVAVVLKLRVAPEDLGKVIGKQGRTALAMRTLLGAAGRKLNKRFTLEIVE